MSNQTEWVVVAWMAEDFLSPLEMAVWEEEMDRTERELGELREMTPEKRLDRIVADYSRQLDRLLGR